MDQHTLPGFRPQSQQVTDGEATEREAAKRAELAAYEANRRALERAIREHCADAGDLLGPGQLPPLPAVRLPPGHFPAALCGPLLAALAALWRYRGAVGLVATHGQLCALLWRFGYRASVATVRRACDQLEAAGALNVLRRVWTAPEGFRDASGRVRRRLQVASVYSLPLEGAPTTLATCGKGCDRTIPICAVLLGCSRRAPKAFSDEKAKKVRPEQSPVDCVHNVPALRAAAPADAEGSEGREAAPPPRRRGLLARFVAALGVAALLALVPSCGRAPLDAPGDAMADADGADDGGPPADAARACRCALRGDAASCAPGCPGGLCCEAP
jgi:hypothetical protein